ncbi:MAG: enoyl-CoA hydratase/isomerase family protein [Candidatus Sericytochromatia bacterium]|nr:enoyl-CoA hydratase/isomerase family protein [Candidatus Tanganyikabacteria bacterium]
MQDTVVHQFARLEVAGGVARLTIDRPPLNVLDMATLGEIDDLLDSLDGTVRVLTIAGAGQKAFSAGVDIKDHTPDRVAAMLEVFHRVILKIRDMPFPTIALVKGVALGGGCELAIACDFIVAEVGARFAQPEIDVGCFPPVAAVLLPRLVGQRRAFEMIMLGTTLGAQEAREAGLVNAVAPAGTLDQAAHEWCERILARSAIVLRLAREAMDVPPALTDAQALERAERIYLDRLMKTHDAAEGLAAFLEKRKPEWKGA